MRAGRRVYGPSCSGVVAHAKADSGRCDDNARICLVSSHLVKIAVDIYGGLPSFSAIH